MSDKNITSYELGNFALHSIGDPCFELANDCKDSHPAASALFFRLGKEINEYGDSMERSDGVHDSSLAMTILIQGIQSVWL